MINKIFLLLSLFPMFSFGQIINEEFISVRGESTLYIDPDRIELAIYFSETENLKKENELQIKESNLKNLLKAFSIDLKHLNVDNLVARRYGYYKSTSNKVRMSRMYKLRVENLGVIDSLILSIFEIGANSVDITNLYSNKLEEKKLESIGIALKNANDKANTIAKYYNKSIGQVLEVKEFNPEVRHVIDHSDSKYHIDRMGSQVSIIREEDIGIRKIVVRYIVDVKYELIK